MEWIKILLLKRLEKKYNNHLYNFKMLRNLIDL